MTISVDDNIERGQAARGTRLEIAAAALANARRERRGVPAVKDVLNIIPTAQRDEHFRDADAVLHALEEADG